MNFKSECEMFDYLEQNCYAAVFSDVLDELGYRFQVISPTTNIRPLKDEYVAAGRAATMLNADDDRMDEPYDLAIKCMGNLKQDSIILTTANTHLDMGIMGELSATALRARGCRGAIVNGYTRDVRKLKEMNFPTFAWGSSAIDTTGRARVVDYNIPITVGGVQIFPEDLIFCDLDGIVVIPKKVEDEVISKTLLLIKTESMVREELAQGIEISEVWEKYHIL